MQIPLTDLKISHFQGKRISNVNYIKSRIAALTALVFNRIGREDGVIHALDVHTSP